MNDDLTLRVDGTLPMSVASVEAVQALCDRAEDHSRPGLVQIWLSGSPAGPWTRELNVGLVSKWERALRRLERLSAITAAVASGDCGGTALDVLLATDIRIAAPGTRLVVPLDGDATWPGMAVHRLTQQAGPAGIRRALLLGAPIGAAEALALGLFDEVVDDPADALAATAELSAALSGREIAIRRQLMFDAGTTSFEDALGAHLAACDRVLRRAVIA